MSMYFDRKGRPLSVEQWAGLFERDPDGYRRVGQDQIGPYRVSTVWLGLDHSIFGGPPLIFETMIFVDGQSDVPDIDYQERYSTEDEAVAGHERACAQARLAAGIAPA